MDYLTSSSVGLWLLLLFGAVVVLLGAWRAYREDQLPTYISTFVFFRFHLGAAAFLVLFAYIAEGSPLLRGVVVIESGRALVIVTALALLAAWVILATAVITYVYGDRQFDTRMPNIHRLVTRYRFALASLLAWPLIYAVFNLSPLHVPLKAVAVALGVLTA